MWQPRSVWRCTWRRKLWDDLFGEETLSKRRPICLQKSPLGDQDWEKREWEIFPNESCEVDMIPYSKDYNFENFEISKYQNQVRRQPPVPAWWRRGRLRGFPRGFPCHQFVNNHHHHCLKRFWGKVFNSRNHRKTPRFRHPLAFSGEPWGAKMESFNCRTIQDHFCTLNTPQKTLSDFTFIPYKPLSSLIFLCPRISWRKSST